MFFFYKKNLKYRTFAVVCGKKGKEEDTICNKKQNENNNKKLQQKRNQLRIL